MSLKSVAIDNCSFHETRGEGGMPSESVKALHVAQHDRGLRKLMNNRGFAI